MRVRLFFDENAQCIGYEVVPIDVEAVVVDGEILQEGFILEDTANVVMATEDQLNHSFAFEKSKGKIRFNSNKKLETQLKNELFAALQRIKNADTHIYEKALVKYGRSEIDSFAAQRAEAKAFVEDGATQDDCPTLKQFFNKKKYVRFEVFANTVYKNSVQLEQLQNLVVLSASTLRNAAQQKFNARDFEGLKTIGFNKKSLGAGFAALKPFLEGFK